MSEVDMVNHPLHYANGTKNFECFDIMKLIFNEDNVAMYCLINAFKYVWRAGAKGDETANEEDLEKAKWYLDHYTVPQKDICHSKWFDLYCLLLNKIDEMLRDTEMKSERGKT